jgi:hypothetical protein
MEVAIGRMIKCSRLNHGDIVGSKQNAENLKNLSNIQQELWFCYNFYKL